MAVFRVERNKGYTVMSNHHLRNKELSLKAKGLLSQMLSLPEDWDYHKPTRMHSNKTAMPLNAALKTAVRGVFYTDTHECLCLQKVFRKLNAAEEGSTVVIVSCKYALSGEFVSSGTQYRRK